MKLLDDNEMLLFTLMLDKINSPSFMMETSQIVLVITALDKLNPPILSMNAAASSDPDLNSKLDVFKSLSNTSISRFRCSMPS